MAEELTDEQLIEIKEAHAAFDKYGDGWISRHNLEKAMYKLGLVPTEAEVLSIIYSIDKDGTGHIPLKEFIDTVAPMLKDYPTEEVLKDAFNVFDKDGTGYITAKQLKEVMVNLGDIVPDEDMDIMIHEADVDGDGKVGFEDFVILMRPNK
ncbi:calmodulin-alpha-like [Agrilus planipennis]|uniref:Calmodulin-alpha-like n=1 Tax=Agrilus planipennis TaxID=224129 RepID=A0A1W4XCL3_AGRPL|nr:calmodulin-alpha-like [Agrilus planipennis]